MKIDPSMTYTREQVVANLRKAASAGPVSFDFLLKQAEIESGLNPYAKASTSSAAGPFQFVNGTWLRMVEKHGDSVGLSEQAAALRENRLDGEGRSNLLALRSDVQIATKMAAHFAADNANVLAASGHKQIGPTELYLAHFLGAGGAAEFLSGMRANPAGSAAEVLPEAARANKNVFFANGAPRSFTEIYNRFAQKFAGVSAPLAGGAEGMAMAPEVAAPNAEGGAVDFVAIAQKALSDSRAAYNASLKARGENSEAVSSGAELTDNMAELSETALSHYLASFSKNFEDPSKATLGASEANSRDASRGAEAIQDLAQAATIFAPPTVAFGMRMLIDAAGSKPVEPQQMREEAQRAAPASAPAVRQAVQWVSLFSDPRGSDAAQAGRA